IPNDQANIEIYKNLPQLETMQQLTHVKHQLIHPFNQYPPELQPFLHMIEIKLYPLHPPITSIKHHHKQLQLLRSQ
ncbi:TRCF domain-containing protein, partial [Staphylococcus argensis]|uniref:TRCF domain-containing protein n=1 Tax=Staphylococcus argensis TaxID=1607738 RepID=UPI0011A761AF